MKIHMYQSRHLFVEDDCVGKFDGKTRTICLFEQYAQHGEPIARWMRQHHGVFPTIATGSLAVVNVAPLVEFPPEIAEKMTPYLGDLTPEVVAWARENFAPEDFKRRYAGRVDDAAPVLAVVDAFAGEEFPQILSDDEERQVTIERKGIAEFTATCEEFPALIGTGETPRIALLDLGEAIEYAEMTKPAPEGEAVEISDEEDGPDIVPEEEEAPAAKKAAKKGKA
jgi:hypothetical protein